jgi:hypothetical protein
MILKRLLQACPEQGDAAPSVSEALPNPLSEHLDHKSFVYGVANPRNIARYCEDLRLIAKQFIAKLHPTWVLQTFLRLKQSA